MPTDADGRAAARYVFRVAFRLEPAVAGLATDPDRFDATLYRRADPPGADGWLFFRDHLWRGELADEDHFREVAEDALGVSVDAVEFRELQTDEAHLESLRSAVGEHLAEFRADSVDRALSKYLGSSIRVVPDEDRRAWFGAA